VSPRTTDDGPRASYCFPYQPIAFDKAGALVDPSQLAAVLTAVARPATPDGLTDLIVISHGWNDDIPEAEALYAKIFDRVAAVLPARNAVCDAVRARRVAIVGIYWPSKKFDDATLIPGGAAGVGDATGNSAALTGALDRLTDALAAGDASSDAARSLARAKTLAASLGGSLDARDEFVRIVRAFMPHDANAEEPVIDDDLFTLGGDELLRRLARPDRPAPGDVDAGGAAGLGDWIGSAIQGAKNLVNLVTYYQMKARAGVVGQGGVRDMLQRIRELRPASGPNALRLHLVGHSFGGRLVTAAAAGDAAAAPLPIDSLTLLQAAFSHYGFAQAYDGTHDGLFRRVVVDPIRVSGPIVITFTAKDRAVGLAYPIASRLGRQIASALGDAHDPYGGMGRNGAQKTPGAQVVTLGAVGTPYAFAPRGVYNLDSNAIIGGHTDLGHDEVAYALLGAVAAS
jgi:hypothetical protein